MSAINVDNTPGEKLSRAQKNRLRARARRSVAVREEQPTRSLASDNFDHDSDGGISLVSMELVSIASDDSGYDDDSDNNIVPRLPRSAFVPAAVTCPVPCADCDGTFLLTSMRKPTGCSSCYQSLITLWMCDRCRALSCDACVTPVQPRCHVDELQPEGRL